MRVLTTSGVRGGSPLDSPRSWLVPDAGVPLSAVEVSGVSPSTIWRTQPSVRKVVGYAARQVAMLPWKVFRRGDRGRERVRDSATEKLLRSPSPNAAVPGTTFKLVRDLVIDALLYDRYLAVVVDGQLFRVPPGTWTVRSDWLGRPAEIRLLTPAGHDDIDATGAPMICGWGWHASKAGGVSPIKTLADTLAESRSAMKWRRRQWEQAPGFGGLLRHPTSFRNKEKMDAFRESWMEWRDGRRGTPILEDGMEYFVPDSPLSKDALDLDGRKLTAIEVATMFHIPPELVGDRDANYGNMQALRAMLYGVVLGPLIEDLQGAANVGLLPRLDAGDDLYVEISREAALNGSLVEQAGVLQTMTGGPVMTRSEARERLNLPLLPDTDGLIVPLNVLVGGQASPTDSGSQNRATSGTPAAPSGAQGAARMTLDEPAAPDRKAQLDALGVAIRSGVTPESAASIVGLPDLAFRPEFIPNSIRLPGESGSTDPIPDEKEAT